MWDASLLAWMKMYVMYKRWKEINPNEDPPLLWFYCMDRRMNYEADTLYRFGDFAEFGDVVAEGIRWGYIKLDPSGEGYFRNYLEYKSRIHKEIEEGKRDWKRYYGQEKYDPDLWYCRPGKFWLDFLKEYDSEGLKRPNIYLCRRFEEFRIKGIELSELDKYMIEKILRTRYHPWHYDLKKIDVRIKDSKKEDLKCSLDCDKIRPAFID
ncbi:MAG: hypothetical protein QXP34_00565 [Candidatus Aenigmatarchaeota archaeon]